MLNRTFEISTPFYGAWKKYGWKKDDWGIGLDKERVDFLAARNETCIVSYDKSGKLYTIKAKKAKTYPIFEIKNYRKLLYIVQKSALNPKKKVEKKDNSIEDLAKMGIFG